MLFHIQENSSIVAGELIIAKMYAVRIRIAHYHTNQCMHSILNKLCSPFFV